MDNLALKLVLTPALIGTATLAGRRWGQSVGGWLVGLPLTTGPVAFFIALDHGTAFAAAAVVGSLVGAVAEAAFSVAYGWSATRTAWLPALLAGSAAYTIVAAILQPLDLGPAALFALVVAALALSLRLMPAATCRARARRSASCAGCSSGSSPSPPSASCWRWVWSRSASRAGSRPRSRWPCWCRGSRSGGCGPRAWPEPLDWGEPCRLDSPGSRQGDPRMRASFYEGSRTFRTGPIPRPSRAPDQALVRVRRAGICGTDLHIFQGHLDHRIPKGGIIGHETFAEVEEAPAGSG